MRPIVPGHGVRRREVEAPDAVSAHVPQPSRSRRRKLIAQTTADGRASVVVVATCGSTPALPASGCRIAGTGASPPTDHLP